MLDEQLLLWAALLVYVAAGCSAVFFQVFQKKFEKTILFLMLAGLVLHTVSLAVRWERLGHGPFNNMYEILSSNIWSLMMFFSVVFWRIPKIRPLAAVVLPIVFIMLAWIMMIPAKDTYLPATYNTIWLFVHIGFGKIFMGALLIAAALSLVIMFREAELTVNFFTTLPANKSLDELAYRFILLALVFDSLMLLAGAIWAQEAWSRYWAWDPLETWSFVSWLMLAFILHLRLTFKPGFMISSVLSIIVFFISFLTFFGLPFLSQVPHQGVV